MRIARVRQQILYSQPRLTLRRYLRHTLTRGVPALALVGLLQSPIALVAGAISQDPAQKDAFARWGFHSGGVSIAVLGLCAVIVTLPTPEELQDYLKD